MNKLLLTTAMMTALAVTPVFASDDMAELKAQIKAMQAEMDKLKIRIAKSEKAAKAAEAKVAESANTKSAKKPENDVKITMMPAPKFETADGAYSFKVGGILQAEVGFSADDKTDHPDGTNIRRARLNASGVIASDFNYKLEVDFAGNATTITDAFIQYAGFKPVLITVGNFKEPFGMEPNHPDIFTTFVEMSGPSTTFPSSSFRRVGAMVSASGKDESLGAWTAAFGAFGGTPASVSSTDDENVDIAGRLTWAPIAEKTQVLHLGASGLYRIIDPSTGTVSFTTRPEAQLSTSSTENALATTSFTADDVMTYGIEAAGVYGPASLQGEYMIADVNRPSGSEPTYDGWYVEGSYFLTGESRNYEASKGVFGRVKPINPFTSKGGYGAWAVMARYSDTDLNDAGLNGGQMKNATFGLRWIPNDYTIISANYISVNTDTNAVVSDDDPDIFVFRAQVDF